MYQHSYHQTLIGPVSTSLMFSFRLNRHDLKNNRKAAFLKTHAPPCHEACCFLNSCSLHRTQPAAAWASPGRPAVSAGQRAAPAKLWLSLQDIWCSHTEHRLLEVLSTDSKLWIGRIITWRLSALFYPLWVTYRPNWPDSTYPFQRKCERCKQEA